MNTTSKTLRIRRRLAWAGGTVSALALLLPLSAAAQQDPCVLIDGTVPEDCERPNAATVVAMPAQPNIELQRTPEVAIDGFAITVNGVPADQTGRPVVTERRQDLALAAADIQVKFDGLDLRPRLDAGVVGDGELFEPGDRVTFQSRTNYPAWIASGEIRILGRMRGGGVRTLATVPIPPNGQASIVLPDGEDLVFVHRVYDARGRYDETAPASLVDPLGDRVATDLEEGTDNTAGGIGSAGGGLRGIPLRGGAVTVYGRNLAPGAQVTTLGETFPAEGGSFVLQRILPEGDHVVAVEVDGPGAQQVYERDIEIPGSEWFYVGIADLTFGRYLQDDLATATGGSFDRNFATGRLAFYAKGKLTNGITITASADTTEDDLENLLRNIDEKDPRSLIDRTDPNEFYPTYGDDSTLEEDAPTAGRIYVRIEKDNSRLTFGTYQSEIRDSHFLPDERTLYGAQLIMRANNVTSRGEPTAELQLNAAQPETLPQRDQFLGTGGSTYFLRYQDIVRGSETLIVETRDPDSGRVLSREYLTYGDDYTINYTQGLVVLRSPLSAYSDDGQLISDGSGGDSAFLVAQYEYTPAATDIDAYSVGARAQVWVADQLRFGASYRKEDTSISSYTASGADIRWQLSEGTFADLEYAETDGALGGLSTSADGGLIIDDIATTPARGHALRFAGQVDLADVVANGAGTIGGYYEERSAGFTTLNYQITSAETLWGLRADLPLGERTDLKLYYDDYETAAGELRREGGAEFAWRATERVKLEFGVEKLDEVTPGDPSETGGRTDAAVRLTYAFNDDLAVYGFAQATLDRSGGLSRNDRAGLGTDLRLNDRWRLRAEVSDGSTGFGARALFNYEDGETAYYAGYTLDPDRTFDSVALNGSDRGSFVVGGTRRITDNALAFGENTYDIFGRHKSLNATYGVTVEHDAFLTYTGAFEVGQIRDDINGDFDRHALSLGVSYVDEMGLSAQARVEYRLEEGINAGNPRDSRTIVVNASGEYRFSDEARLLASIDAAYSDQNDASIPDTEFFEGAVGYAFRPVDNDRLNVLAKYKYLRDLTGQVVNGAASTAPLQKSHVLSLDASYDLNRQWTIGGKIGLRYSESDDGTGFVENNAWLAVLNARYHVVHNWDLLVEARVLDAVSTDTTQTGLLVAGYRHVGNNVKVGLGYNFGRFSDDLTDLTYDDQGVFVNIIAKF